MDENVVSLTRIGLYSYEVTRIIGLEGTFFRASWKNEFLSHLICHLPVYLGMTIFNMSVIGARVCILFLIVSHCLLFPGRYTIGTWHKMLMIDKEGDRGTHF